MKLKRKFFGSILASLMLFAAILSCTFTMNAKLNYRGFVEGGIGATTISDATGQLSYVTTSSGICFFLKMQYYFD